MKKTVLVEFQVTLEVNDWSQYEVSEYVAEQLAISIMLRELKVNQIKIGGHEFNLESWRKRMYRCK